MTTPPPVDRDRAEWIAVRLLGALADDVGLLTKFLVQTGHQAATLRACAKDPRFQATLVDFVCDEAPAFGPVLGALSLTTDDLEMARFALREVAPRRRQRARRRLPMPPRRFT